MRPGLSPFWVKRNQAFSFLNELLFRKPGIHWRSTLPSRRLSGVKHQTESVSISERSIQPYLVACNKFDFELAFELPLWSSVKLWSAFITI